MELFLLLSIGMSIVAFISIALDQAPYSQSVVEQKLEPTISLEAKMAVEEFEVLGLQRSITQVPTVTSQTEGVLLAATA